MLRKADSQLTFSVASFWCGAVVPKDSFYAKLNRHGHDWFRDEDYASMYSSRRGRPSVPPSLLARAILLQNYDNLSDRELVDRIRFDLRYKMALDVPVDYAGFDPSLLSIFRSRLVLHELERSAFDRSIEKARESKVLTEGAAQAIDSAPIDGAAAVQDTYTLLRTGIEKALVIIGKLEEETLRKSGYAPPFPSELYLGEKRGKPDIDWNDRAERRKYLGTLTGDAHLLLAAVDGSRLKDIAEVATGCELLRKLIDQDIDEQAHGGPQIKKRVAENRIISTNDTDMRHGRKSASTRIDGYKSHVTVDVGTEMVTAVDVTPANVHDSVPMSKLLVEQKLRGTFPGRLYGDCAYGSGDSRAELRNLRVDIVAKVPQSATTVFFPKTAFTIDLSACTVTCPAGQTTDKFHKRKDDRGRPVKLYYFTRNLCFACALRERCTTNKDGRHVVLHFHEELLQQARVQASQPGFRQERKTRLVVERVQARLKRYGLASARYFGMKKVRFQALWTAAANNFWRGVELLEAQPKLYLA